jgi:hypothetical protein
MTPGCCLLSLRCHMLQLHLGLVHRRSSLNTRSISHHTLPNSNPSKWYVRAMPSCMGQANNFDRPPRTPPVSRRCSMYVQPKLLPGHQSDRMFRHDSYMREANLLWEDKDTLATLGRAQEESRSTGLICDNRQSARRRRSYRRVCLSKSDECCQELGACHCSPVKTLSLSRIVSLSIHRTYR